MSETARNTKIWVLALTSAASFMAALDTLAVTTALSSIRLDLSVPIESLEWTVNAYNISFAVLLLTGAALGDRFGRRRVFASGLALFLVASAVCALAGNEIQLIAGRAAQGVGAALIMPLAMALLSAAFPREQRARALGLFGGITGLALIAGPVLGGAITTGFAWQWIFWINLPIGLIALLMIRRRIPESFGDASFDLAGVVLAGAAALALVFGLMRTNLFGWTSAQVAVPLAAGALLAAAFVAHERRTRSAMVPLRLFALRGFAAGNVAGFFLYASMYGALFFLPQFLQSAQGHDALAAGLRLLPWTATLFVFAPIGGALVNRVGERPLILAGVLLQALGFAWVATIATPVLSDLALAGPLLIAGAGVSLAMPAAQNAVLGAVAPEDLGKASGIFNMWRFFGGVFGIALEAAGFAAAGSFDSPASFNAGFIAAMSVAAALSLAAVAAAAWLPGRAATSARLAKA